LKIASAPALFLANSCGTDGQRKEKAKKRAGKASSFFPFTLFPSSLFLTKAECIMASIRSGYVSADGHVVEPADLWTKRMDKRFRDRAPRVESRPDADYYMIDGITPFPVGLEGVTIEEKIAGQVMTPKGRRHAETRPGAWDPQLRLVDQTRDHLRAEVIYPGGFGLQFFHVRDAEYQQAAMRVYNDWIGEF
jgi:hypothetical protein